MEYLFYALIVFAFARLIYGIHADIKLRAQVDALLEMEKVLIRKALIEAETIERQNTMLDAAKVLHTRAVELLK